MLGREPPPSRIGWRILYFLLSGCNGNSRGNTLKLGIGGYLGTMAQKKMEERLEAADREIMQIRDEMNGIKIWVQKIPTIQENLSMLAQSIEKLSLKIESESGHSEIFCYYNGRHCFESTVERKEPQPRGFWAKTQGSESIEDNLNDDNELMRKMIVEKLGSDRSKFKNVKMPVFDGKDPDSWLFRA